jgi:carboxypeptidase C (cathepsin A)
MKTLISLSLLTSSVAIGKEKSKPSVQKIPKIETYVTHHTGKFNGQTVKYTVTAEDTHFKNAAGDPVSSIFTIAYTKDGVKNKSQRPVTFLFNGGPGSASLWLHMGVFGPKRIDVPSDAINAGAAPYRLINNPLSLLDVTDIVFIDPVGTGYSKVIGKGKGKDFWGVSEDAKSVGNFIREYVTKNNRWNSPKYIGGESYGTTRTAALVRELQSGYNAMALNGLILISSILDFQTVDKGMSNDSSYLFFLPTYAATAWYHGKVEKKGTIEDFLAEVREFALNEYSVALIKGNKLPKAEEEKIITKLSNYTGLSKNYLKNARMRVSEFRFMKELLRDEGKSVGRLDSRFTGLEADDAGETFEADPSGYGISSAYTAAINQYMRKDLKVRKDYRYEVLSGKPGRKWNWKLGRRGGYTTVGPFIAKGMRQNKDLRVYVANGYYDMATPFFATEHTLSRYGIDPTRVTMTYYESGHMMYIHHPSLNKLAKTVRQFILDGQK